MTAPDENIGENNRNKHGNKVNRTLGAGKYLIIFGILMYLFLASVNKYIFPKLVFPIISDRINLVIGVIMLLIGVILYLRILPWLIKINKTNELYKEGPFRIVRHPLYSVILLIIIPGITILLKLVFVLIS
ncbi:MAG: hypothetical protein ACTSU2_15975 [Promethearchaeota archaeon]